MDYRHTTDTTTQDHSWLYRFKNGEPAALDYIYKQAFRALVKYGRGIIDDEFTVSTIVQEAALKAWQFRDRMESLFHIYRFMRLNVSWRCLSCYRDPQYRFHSRLVKADNLDHVIGAFHSAHRAEQEPTCFNEERENEICNLIPYLSPQRQTIIALYFKYGLSHKRIASRFSMSTMAVHIEMRKGLAQLKKIILSRKKMAASASPKQNNMAGLSDMMPQEMWMIFKYRYENKMGFESIAEKMNLELPYIRQKYVEAHKRWQQLKKRA